MHTSTPEPQLDAEQCAAEVAATQPLSTDASLASPAPPWRRAGSSLLLTVGLCSAGAAATLLGCQPAGLSTSNLPAATLTETFDAPGPVLTGPPANATLPANLLPSAALTPAVAEPTTIWDRIRNGFALDHGTEREAVQAQLQWLQRNPGYFKRRAERFARFLPSMVEQIDAAGLPLEVVMMPVVESALDPYAFSPGGAAGLWQFIPTTADRFGLERNYWYEGRRDLAAATGAAIKYLEALYRRFDNWELAIAAYNAGEGNVSHSLRRYRRANPQTDLASLDGSPFWFVRLPAETTQYVPRILALAAAINDPQRYGLTLPVIPLEPALVSIDLPGQFDLLRVAEHSGVDLETLYQLNPALNQWATPPNGPHRLFIPSSFDASAIEATLAAVPPKERVGWTRITVAAGDTLSTLAQRHGTDVPSIQRTNQLAHSRIRVGQPLFIPKSAGAADQYPIARQRAGKKHRVKAGESLWLVARKHGVRVEQLVRWNELHPKTPLRVGQQLFVSRSNREVVRRVNYRVRSGDSLYSIAKRFETSTSSIAEWNALDEASYLRPGQKLTLHINVTKAPHVSVGH